MTKVPSGVSVALACGGTGGHLFPGLAVAHELADRGARVILFVSPKEVDQEGVVAARGRFEIVTLPLVAFSRRRAWTFLKGTWDGYRTVEAVFAQGRPAAVLAMGGFTAVAPVLAGRRMGARVFLHESNTVPGRANRWLSRLTEVGCVGFPEAAKRWPNQRVQVTGTPVRKEIRQAESGPSRRAHGLDENRPVLLVTGGSQGAQGVNRLMLACLAGVAHKHSDLQFVHLTGPSDFSSVSEAYGRMGIPALVRPFSHRMDQLLAAATVAVSRSGASSLAEMAARRLPSVLIPYPTAADDHQRHNAAAFVRAGAARMLDQATADGPALGKVLDELLSSSQMRQSMSDALAGLDIPQAATEIAELISRKIMSSMATSEPRGAASPGAR